MTYDIVITPVGDWLWQADVVVKDEQGNTVLTGQTTISCETEQEAYDYAEKVFLSDLRRNFTRQAGELVFPWEAEVLEGKGEGV